MDRAPWVGKHSFHERIDREKAVITAWLDGGTVTKKAKGRLDYALDQLAQLPQQMWCKPQPASSLGNHTYVIRFKENGGGQLRIFGHFSAFHSAFVMTFDGFEKDNVYHPHDYEERAVSHKDKCEANASKSSVAFRDRCEPCRERVQPVRR